MHGCADDHQNHHFLKASKPNRIENSTPISIVSNRDEYLKNTPYDGLLKPKIMRPPLAEQLGNVKAARAMCIVVPAFHSHVCLYARLCVTDTSPILTLA